MVFLTGDTHGNIDIAKLNSKRFKEGASLTKNDYVIILGDCGIVWDNSATDLYWRKWLDNKPWTTLFIDGNHENFNLLYEFPLEPMLGGNLRKISSSIYHIPRGEILEIEGKRFFAFGGAVSIDKAMRKENISWWHQEEPTREEMNYAVKNLETVDFNVDYVLTHTCPSDVMPYIINNGKINGELERFLNFIDFCINEKKSDYTWYFGHFHTEYDGKYNCIYQRVIRII